MIGNISIKCRDNLNSAVPENIAVLCDKVFRSEVHVDFGGASVIVCYIFIEWKASLLSLNEREV